MLTCLHWTLFPLPICSIHVLLLSFLFVRGPKGIVLLSQSSWHCFFLLVLLLICLITNNNHELDYVNPKNRLIKLKHNNPTKIIIGHLNINSIRFKFEFIKEPTGNNIDIFLISETKLNDTFPSLWWMVTMSLSDLEEW